MALQTNLKSYTKAEAFLIYFHFCTFIRDRKNKKPHLFSQNANLMTIDSWHSAAQWAFWGSFSFVLFFYDIFNLLYLFLVLLCFVIFFVEREIWEHNIGERDREDMGGAGKRGNTIKLYCMWYFLKHKRKRKKTGKELWTWYKVRGENLWRVGEKDGNDEITISKLLSKSSFPLLTWPFGLLGMGNSVWLGGTQLEP